MIIEYKNIDGSGENWEFDADYEKCVEVIAKKLAFELMEKNDKLDSKSAVCMAKFMLKELGLFDTLVEDDYDNTYLEEIRNFYYDDAFNEFENAKAVEEEDRFAFRRWEV